MKSAEKLRSQVVVVGTRTGAVTNEGRSSPGQRERIGADCTESRIKLRTP